MNLQRIGSAKIFVLLGFLTVIFWLLSINYTPSIDKVLPPDPFFFANNLSVFYWLSLASLFTLLFLRLITPTTKKLGRLLDVFLICCLILVIYGTPCLVYNLPVYVDTYLHTSASLKILLRGHTPPPQSMMGASNEPGGYLFFSIFMLTTDLDSLIFMQYYPILISSVLLLSLYVASSKFVNPNFAILTPFVFTAFRYNRYYVYPGSLAHLFYALFLLFLGFLVERNEKEFKLSTLLVVSSATITYILAPPLLFLSSLLPFIPLLSKMKVQRNFIAPTTIFVIWISWLICASQGSFTYIVSWLKEALIGPTLELPASVVSPASVRIIPLLLKQAITAFAILTGILLALLCLMNNKKTLEKEKALIVGENFIACLSLLLLAITFPSEGTYTRFYSFLMIPYSLLVPMYISTQQNANYSKLIELRRIVTYTLLASMVFFLSITPIVRNDNDPGFYYPSSSLKGAEYSVENLKGKVVWVRAHLHLIAYMASRRGILLEGYMDSQQDATISFISLSRYPFLSSDENAFMLYFSKEIINNCDAMIFNDYEDAMMIMQGVSEYDKLRMAYEEYISRELNRIYSSGTVRIYTVIQKANAEG